MVPFETVTAKNALLYAMHVYDNPQCLSAEEFAEDYKRFKYIKRLCRRYLTSGDIKERLMVNHLVLLANVFGVTPMVRLLFIKCDPDAYVVLKPFLLYLNMLPEVVWGVNGINVYTDRIHLDEPLYRTLRGL